MKNLSNITQPSHSQCSTDQTKTIFGKRFYKDIDPLMICVDENKVDITIMNMITDKMVTNLNVFGPRMLERVFG